MADTPEQPDSRGGVINRLMHSSCPADREPTPTELVIAYEYGADDGDWCRKHDHEAEAPPHLLSHPLMQAEWKKGYESTRRRP